MTAADDPGGPDHDALEALARRALSILGVQADAEISLTLADLDRMAELNARAFGRREPTDVLAFPIDDPRAPSPGPVVLGDVVVCPAVAERHARALGRLLDDELSTLVVHGTLHLLGWDHADALAEQAMAAEEQRILAEAAGGA
jgi:probable rRNA maturation factor